MQRLYWQMKCPVMQKFDEDFDLSSESCNVSDPLNFINFHIVFLILINSVNFEMLRGMIHVFNRQLSVCNSYQMSYRWEDGHTLFYSSIWHIYYSIVNGTVFYYLSWNLLWLHWPWQSILVTADWASFVIAGLTLLQH